MALAGFGRNIGTRSTAGAYLGCLAAWIRNAPGSRRALRVVANGPHPACTPSGSLAMATGVEGQLEPSNHSGGAGAENVSVSRVTGCVMVRRWAQRAI